MLGTVPAECLQPDRLGARPSDPTGSAFGNVLRPECGGMEHHPPSTVLSAPRPRPISDTVAVFESLLATDPASPQLRADLAQALLAAGDLDGAIEEASAVLERHPSAVQAWLTRATAHKARHDFSAAAEDFTRALQRAPDRGGVLVNLAHCLAEQDRLPEAENILRRAVAVAPRSAEAQVSLGSVLVRQGRLDEAEAPCRAALALDPELVRAHQNLSAILAATDPAGARGHRDAAYRRQQVFIDPAATSERTVLVLAAADAANVPLQHLMPPARTTLIRWYVEYATPEQDRALPRFDVVFNAIGEAELAPALPPPVLRLLDRCGSRVINHPDSVAQTSRVNLPRLLSGIEGVLVPPVVRLGPDLPTRMAVAAMTFPVLVRPLGTHGGEGVRLVNDPAGLSEWAETPGTVTQFVDFVSADGWHRKYRMVFVDGGMFPYHLAISRHWLVHHWTAGMEHDAARRGEEARFLASPRAALGEDAMTALAKIGACLGLDYGGVDFSLLPDGRVVVFEANATMLVHPEEDADFAYRNPVMERIQAAFTRLLASRSR